MQKILLVAILALAGCKAEPPAAYMAQEPDPTADRQGYYQFLLRTMPETLDKVTCHCCRKPLSRCFQDSLSHAPGACPFGWGICFNEGRDVLAMKRAGLGDAEVVRRIDEKFAMDHPTMGGHH